MATEADWPTEAKDSDEDVAVEELCHAIGDLSEMTKRSKGYAAKQKRIQQAMKTLLQVFEDAKQHMIDNGFGEERTKLQLAYCHLQFYCFLLLVVTLPLLAARLAAI